MAACVRRSVSSESNAPADDVVAESLDAIPPRSRAPSAEPNGPSSVFRAPNHRNPDPSVTAPTPSPPKPVPFVAPRPRPKPQPRKPSFRIRRLFSPVRRGRSGFGPRRTSARRSARSPNTDPPAGPRAAHEHAPQKNQNKRNKEKRKIEVPPPAGIARRRLPPMPSRRTRAASPATAPRPINAQRAALKSSRPQPPFAPEALLCGVDGHAVELRAPLFAFRDHLPEEHAVALKLRFVQPLRGGQQSRYSCSLVRCYSVRRMAPHASHRRRPGRSPTRPAG